MPPMPAYTYIILDGHYYVVQSGTYVRTWKRLFTSTLSANILELNFIDNGPGIKTYDMTLILASWSPDSAIYKTLHGLDPAIASLEQQITNLEASFALVATELGFTDPFGNSPAQGYVYFTLLTENLPVFSTAEKPYLLVDIEVMGSSAI